MSNVGTNPADPSTTHVPVGEDQVQHLELTRDLAAHVNNRYAQPVFTVPDIVLGDWAALVVSAAVMPAAVIIAAVAVLQRCSHC